MNSLLILVPISRARPARFVTVPEAKHVEMPIQKGGVSKKGKVHSLSLYGDELGI
jgi:hypothetical protein